MAPETFTKEQFWSELDALGEEDVRVRFSVTKQFGDVGTKHELTKLWLKRFEDSRASEAANKRDAREDKTLRLASRANIIAYIAVIIAAIAAHKEITALISSVMSWSSK